MLSLLSVLLAAKKIKKASVYLKHVDNSIHVFVFTEYSSVQIKINSTVNLNTDYVLVPSLKAIKKTSQIVLDLANNTLSVKNKSTEVLNLIKSTCDEKFVEQRLGELLRSDAISAQLLLSAMQSTYFAAGKFIDKAILHHTNIRVNNSQTISAAATNGHVLASYNSTNNIVEGSNYNVLAEDLPFMEILALDTEETFTLAQHVNGIEIKSSQMVYHQYANKIGNNNYPDWPNLLLTGNAKYTVTINTDLLVKALQQTNEQIVRVTFGAQTEVSKSDQSESNINYVVPNAASTLRENEPVTIHFNSELLIKILTGADTVTFSIGSDAKSQVIINEDSCSPRLIMPFLLKH